MKELIAFRERHVVLPTDELIEIAWVRYGESRMYRSYQFRRFVETSKRCIEAALQLMVMMSGPQWNQPMYRRVSREVVERECLKAAGEVQYDDLSVHDIVTLVGFYFESLRRFFADRQVSEVSMAHLKIKSWMGNDLICSIAICR